MYCIMSGSHTEPLFIVTRELEAFYLCAYKVEAYADYTIKLLYFN